jgi:hypothetical protein
MLFAHNLSSLLKLKACFAATKWMGSLARRRIC